MFLVKTFNWTWVWMPFYLSIICFLISFANFMQVGFVFNNAYIFASKEDKKKIDKKPYYRQSAICFAILGMALLINSLEAYLGTRYLYYLFMANIVIVVIYAIVSSIMITKKKRLHIRFLVILTILNIVVAAIIQVFHFYIGTNKIDIAINKICKNKTIAERVDNSWEEYDNQVADNKLDLREVEYNGKKYEELGHYIDGKYVGELLTEKEQSFFKTVGSVKIQIYKMKDMSEELAIAVKVPEDDKYYFYYYYEYEADSAKQLIEDFGFNDIGECVWIGLYPKRVDVMQVSVDEGILDRVKDAVKQLGNGKIIDKTDANETGLHLTVWFDNVRWMCSIQFYDNGDVSIVLPFTVARMGYVIRMGEEGIDLALDILKYCEENGKGTYSPKPERFEKNYK